MLTATSRSADHRPRPGKFTVPAIDGPNRSIRPRRGLPGGRAVTGGLLIAVAAVGIFAAVNQANQPPSTRYVVAARDLAVGQVVERGDLRSVALDLPRGQAGRAFRADRLPLGRVVLAPITGGELLQAGVLGSPNRGVATVALSLERAEGLGGSLQAGDRVDVYVSYGNGTTSSTRRVIASAEVTAIGDPTSTVGSSGRVQVTLAVPDESQRIDVVNAGHAGTVTLARVTAAEPTAGAGGGDVFVEQERNNESTAAPEPATSAPTPTTKPR